MDQARLRANARELRTLLTELDAAARAHADRIVATERPKVRDFEPTEDERARLESARLHLVGPLARHFLALVEELAGDIDQDVTTWKPPPE